MQVQFLGQDDPLAEEMATRSSILAWKIPQTEEPGGPQGCKELDTTEHAQHAYSEHRKIYHTIKMIVFLLYSSMDLNTCIDSHNYHHNQNTEEFHHSQILLFAIPL